MINTLRQKNLTSTPHPLKTATFDWCLRNAQRCIARNALEDALKWSSVAAETAVSFRTGQLVSVELETQLLQLAHILPLPNRKVENKDSATQHWLHIMSCAFPTGGHTACLKRWIQLDSSQNRHSVILLNQDRPIPTPLWEVVKASGGDITSLDARSSLLARAMQLRQEAWHKADRIVLHVHPDDVVPTVAFGVAGGPPVLLFNHADHLFWVGASIADVVLNIRDLGQLWTAQHRGIQRNVILPVPLSAPEELNQPIISRARARQDLGLPLDATVLLTVGEAYKYNALPGLDFLEVAARILESHPSAYIVAVGPVEDSRWQAVKTATGGRLSAVGRQNDLTPYHAAADIYLAGFPLDSLTAMLEVGLLNIPCVRSPQQRPPFFADGAALAAQERPLDITDYVRQVSVLIADKDERHRQGAALGNNIRAHHCGANWQQYLAAADAELPPAHKVYKIVNANPPPKASEDFWIDFRRINYAEIVEATFQSALNHHLKPRIDTPLAEAMLTSKHNWETDFYFKTRSRPSSNFPYHLKSRLTRHLTKQITGRKLQHEAYLAHQADKNKKARELAMRCISMDIRCLGSPAVVKILLESLVGKQLMKYMLRFKHRLKPSSQVNAH